MNMLELLWLIPAFPLAGFVLLAVFGGRLKPRHIAWIGVGSVGLSALITGLVAAAFVALRPMGDRFIQILWRWMDVSGFSPAIAFHLDALSLIMILVITFVGFLIHVYSSEFMAGDEGYGRFFAYMNLFVASMLTLVLADNLLLLYLGWEGVGLCSYLLIGFWYRESANGRAAQKAFIVTRIGDTAFAIGLFLLFTHLGTLNIQDLLRRAQQEWGVGAVPAVAATLLLLGGAIGKSAQLPLQTWLPDAMAGPTPVSALIHAATMVTAGVYLIARLHTLYELAPAVQFAVGVIGAVTLLIAASSALAQRDIKRALAYSTISQIGYMFLALGVGAWSAALFHFMTHAFFKALLFLAAGAVIVSLHEEHDIFRMGGLRTRLPIVFWTFLIGAASLAGLPLVTAGFYSKDWILWEAWSSPHGSMWLWAAGVCGALLTAIYSFRLVFYVFCGETNTVPHVKPRPSMTFPLIVLAILSVIAGGLETPRTLGHITLFSGFMQSALPAVASDQATQTPIAAEVTEQMILAVVTFAGIGLAYVLFLRRRDLPNAMVGTAIGASISKFLFEGWRFDALYDLFVIRPFLWIAAVNRNDGIDRVYAGIAWLNRWLHGLLHRTQTGHVRWYATIMAAGAVAIVALALFV
jgi:NADH-quinone oxidoreductase subunit L